MSILTKPYEISIWKDVYEEGELREQRVAVIGADTMDSQSRVLEPSLVSNVNGTKSLTFKLYRYYNDNATGERVENPFVGLLIAERKVKLKYNNKWYDFIVKNIVENSTNYLYTYQLEDALVQELSKNGFNVTLDEKLMNNVGSAKTLAETTLKETDWKVASEVFVETIDEALVYVTIPANTPNIRHIFDQGQEYLKGVTDKPFVNTDVINVLAFYSSCQNKPHRFQFIYSDNGYGKDKKGLYKINRKDDRTIDEPNCQYYIEFDNPEEDYVAVNSNGLNLLLPKGFGIGVPGVKIDDTEDKDSYLSSWYRGKRYGFSQQSIYVPVLDRYCQKFSCEQIVDLENPTNVRIYQDSSQWASGSFKSTSQGLSFSGTKTTEWWGLQVDMPDNPAHSYLLHYDLEVKNGRLFSIGGRNHFFNSFMTVKCGEEIYTTSDDFFDFNKPITSGKITVDIIYTKNQFASEDASPEIFIQPNGGLTNEIEFVITNLKLSYGKNCLGYVESKFTSPTLITNYINNYKFESTAGWIATSSTAQQSATKAAVEDVYGRFNNNSFVPIDEDFFSGSYKEELDYKSYMKIIFHNNDQFVLNSGIRDNRVVIENMPEGEEWVLDYKIVDSTNKNVSDKFIFSLGEYIYDVSQGSYVARKGSISFDISNASKLTDYHRRIITVGPTNYTSGTFKKDSKIYLCIKPNEISEDAPDIYFIEKIALYKKSEKDGQIISPDYESEQSIAAETYIDSGIIEKKYHYFSEWLIDENNPYAIIEKESLPTIVKNELNYNTFKPVYNTGAEKIRTVSVSESNYFNILQSIAETFGVWLDLEVTRDNGAITEKWVYFKNYIGKENFANFTYGINLKDIQRTYNSKNIVTKLIVKQNANELAENGFCTIARAGANPTGENSIYDFQYYHNTDILPVKDYLNKVYYMDGAEGPDSELWMGDNGEEGFVKDAYDYTLEGYYPRIKKINEAIEPTNDELIGLKTDLVQLKSSLKVAEATYEAAVTGIESTREDFLALTGVYPEEAQDGQINSVQFNGTIEPVYDKQNNLVSDESEPRGIVPQEDWWKIASGEQPTISGTTVTVPIAVANGWDDVPYEVKWSGSTKVETMSSGKVFRMEKTQPYGGICIEADWNKTKDYILTYELECLEGTLENIGCHNTHFRGHNATEDFTITIKKRSGEKVHYTHTSICQPTLGLSKNEKYFVTVRGKRHYLSDASDQDDNLWIQPNRGSSQKTTCVISNIQLREAVTGNNMAKSHDRTAHFYLNVIATINGKEVPRTYNTSCVIPAGVGTGETFYAVQEITAVDTSRSDVQKYITEYTLHYEKRESSAKELADLKTRVASKEESIRQKEARLKRLLEYKKQLNHKFFERYSRFILEGTWISEEYVDDEKYYADAQSVLYNSCYPQVVYSINVLSLAGLPGYEDFDFELGDKTYAIDEEFFGSDKREEVVITELSERLDDPSKNTIKVQNFKNQFQDLFQRITATTQQAQYSSGAYEKGASLVDANNAKKNEFITSAINEAEAFLAPGRSHTVTWEGGQGITVTDDIIPTNQVRIVGGAILLSIEDPVTKEMTWKTGLTNKGISADLITTGRLDAGVVQIMSGTDPVFRWDAYGISAYDAHWLTADGVSTISGINTKKFVRFDKYGIYGINEAPGIDGANWRPSKIDNIIDKSTFALTWEGLKVKSPGGATVLLGRNRDNGNKYLIRASTNEYDVFSITEDGTATIRGNLLMRSGDSVEGKFESIGQTLVTNDELIKSLQNQIDGAISTWFYEGEPTKSNEPAVNWSDDIEKEKHVGDLYYDTKTQYCYRWSKEIGGEDTRYIWVRIADEDITEALRVASEAKTAADGKSTIFYNNPMDDENGYPTNYQIGDIWIVPSGNTQKFKVQGIEDTYAGKILQCISVEGDDFSAKWQVATTYVDNDSAKGLIDKAIEALNLPTDWNYLTNDIQIEYNSDAETGKTIITVKDKNGGIISTTESLGGYIATDVGLGSGQLENNNKFILKSDGTLQADNAIIYGTIFANAGEIGGVSIENVAARASDNLLFGSEGPLVISDEVSGPYKNFNCLNWYLKEPAPAGTYVFSASFVSDSTAGCSILFYNSSTKETSEIFYLEQSENERATLEMEIKIPFDQVRVFGGAFDQTAGQVVTLSKIKLERGVTATAWREGEYIQGNLLSELEDESRWFSAAGSSSPLTFLKKDNEPLEVTTAVNNTGFCGILLYGENTSDHSTSPLNLERNTQYTLSWEAKFNIENLNPEGEGDSGSVFIYQNGWQTDNILRHTFSIGDIGNWTRYTWTFTTLDIDYQKCVLAIIFLDQDPKTQNYFSIRKVKLEKGGAPTTWGSGQQNFVLSNVNDSNFSWKFSSAKGMLMWNGLQGSGEVDKDDNLVLRVDNSGLYVKGRIVAMGGAIAGWQITSGALKLAQGDNEEYCYFGAETTTSSVFNETQSNILFKAGTNFALSKIGQMYCNYAEIGGWIFSNYIIGPKREAFLFYNGEESEYEFASLRQEGTSYGRILSGAMTIENLVTRYTKNNTTSSESNYLDFVNIKHMFNNSKAYWTIDFEVSSEDSKYFEQRYPLKKINLESNFFNLSAKTTMPCAVSTKIDFTSSKNGTTGYTTYTYNCKAMAKANLNNQWTIDSFTSTGILLTRPAGGTNTSYRKNLSNLTWTYNRNTDKWETSFTFTESKFSSSLTDSFGNSTTSGTIYRELYIEPTIAIFISKYVEGIDLDREQFTIPHPLPGDTLITPGSSPLGSDKQSHLQNSYSTGKILYGKYYIDINGSHKKLVASIPQIGNYSISNTLRFSYADVSKATTEGFAILEDGSAYMSYLHINKQLSVADENNNDRLGVSGSFIDKNGKVITIINGIVVSIG